MLPDDPNPAQLPTLRHVVLIYRVSSHAAGGSSTWRSGWASSKKAKPAYVQKETCLLNFVNAATAFIRRFPRMPLRVIAIKDCCDAALSTFVDEAFAVLRVAQPALIYEQHVTSFKSGALSFCFALDALKELPPALLAHAEQVGVYLCEDDYIHSVEALATIFSGLALAPLASGYDHPDKYILASSGGNPLVQEGGEVSRVLRGTRCHFKTTNSTTMTFAATLQTLLQDEIVMREACEAEPPDDFHLFLALRAARGRTLVTPLPAACTHGETAHLAPFFPAAKLGERARELLRTFQD